MRKADGMRLALPILAVLGFAVTAHAADEMKIKLFPLQDVRLLEGPFAQAQEVDHRYLLAHDVDRLLAPFRTEAGLTPRAPAYGSWESSGLAGHSAGHYLSALAMMYASTGDAELKRRLDYMVSELADCQRANGNGYVGGVPKGKELWEQVAAGQLKVTGFGINDRWVPWYNLHKTFAGLRDACVVAHNEQAKEVLVRLADWCLELMGHLSDEQMQHMLRAEHGGMNEVLADVSALTGEEKYLAAARRFCDQQLLQPLADQRDELTGKHANTQIPKVIGFQRIASLGESIHRGGDDDAARQADVRLHRAAAFFWETVTSRRSVAIGGNSVNEHFNPPDNFGSMIEERSGPETCNTYNVLRLTESLFENEPSAHYADFYERALFNHILSSEHPGEGGGFVYFTPMRPGHYRVYSTAGQSFWCCVGTGFENHAKYGRFIYAHQGDVLYVTLFVASELQWKAHGLTLRQTTRFPDEARTRLVLQLRQPSTFTLVIRHPKWLNSSKLTVLINGEKQDLDSPPSSYAQLKRQWTSGDVVEVLLPMQLAAERLPDQSDYVAMKYGPIVLAAATGNEDMKDLRAGDGRDEHVGTGLLQPLQDAPTLVSSDVKSLPTHFKPDATGDEPLAFRADDLIRPQRYANLKLIPFFQLHDARYVIYWRVASPEKYADDRAQLAAEEEARLALDAITLDHVVPGEQQSEVDHHFKGERTSNGMFSDRSWRDARGWFSYELTVPKHGRAEVMVTYWGGDRGRDFDVLANDRLLEQVQLDGSRGARFFDVRYAIPEEACTTGKVTLKFQANPGSLAGGVFDLRSLKEK